MYRWTDGGGEAAFLLYDSTIALEARVSVLHLVYNVRRTWFMYVARADALPGSVEGTTSWEPAPLSMRVRDA